MNEDKIKEMIMSFIGYLLFTAFIICIFNWEFFSSFPNFLLSILTAILILFLYSCIMFRKKEDKKIKQDKYNVLTLVFEKWNYITCSSLIALAIISANPEGDINNPLKNPIFRSLLAIFIISGVKAFIKLQMILLKNKNS